MRRDESRLLSDLQAVFQHTPDFIWSVDSDYRFLTFNAALHDQFVEGDKKIGIGVNHVDLLPAPEAGFWKEAYDRALRGEHLSISEHRNPDRTIQFSLSPIRQNEAITGVVGIGRDVSHSHRVVQAIERSLQEYQILLEASPLPVWTINLETLRFSQVNRAALELYGYSQEEFDQLTIRELRPAEDQATFERSTLPFIRSNHKAHHAYTRHRCRDGRLLDIEVYSHYFEPDGVPSRLTFIKDLTHQRNTERALREEHTAAIQAKEHAEEMNRLKSVFLANMSHEIRTPLMAILGFAEVLEEDLADPEQRDHATAIRTSGERLLATINQILDLARIESGKVELRPVECSVGEAVEECARLLFPLADKKGLTIKVQHRSPAFTAWVDKLYFDQILTNIVGNAIKFSSSGTITISIWNCTTEPEKPPAPSSVQAGRTPQPCLAIEITDQGIGISPEFLPHIFDAFQQESAGYDRRYEGTGLGLAITATLVQKMGGAISVSSEPGRGSSFIIRLPLQ